MLVAGAYFRPLASDFSISALSVFSQEKAVNFSPLSRVTSKGLRPKWP